MRKFLAGLCFGILSCSSPNLKITQVELPPEKPHSQYESFGKNFMIASQGVGSTEAAAEIINKGGNLFDAFTAVSFAIGVERPQSTGIGGGGFVLFYSAKDKKVYSLDFREMAPRKADSKMFLDEYGKVVADRSLTGALAVGIPGHIAGVLEIQKKYGKLPLSEVMKPAIRMAEEGITVYPNLVRATSEEKERLLRYPSSKAIFLSPEGEPWPVGHKLIQKDLAKTLRLISKSGAREFYKGGTSRKIAATIAKYKGLLDQKDLASYKTVWREPVSATYNEYQIYSQPPPSSGGVHVIEILNAVEKDQLKKWGPQDPRSIHLTASAMQRAFYDRALFMGDPDFVKVPVERLTSKKYAAEIRSEINLDRARKASQISEKKESPETTHFSLMDSTGNAIVSTQTINGYFGSALVAEGTGIMLNNEMDDFAAQAGASNLFGAVGGENNLVEPGKRPLSSMSPTLVMKEGLPFLALGTPSGTRIITCVAQTILNVIEYQMPLWEAVSLTRYHEQWQPDELQIETPMFSEKTLDALKSKGWILKNKNLGCRIEAIQKDKGALHGVSDPREEGASVGL